MSENINHNIKLTYELQIIKDGKVINSIKNQSRSFTKHFAFAIESFLTNGFRSKTFTSDWGDNFNLNIGNLSGATYVAIGTGTSPVTPMDTNLTSTIKVQADPTNTTIETDRCWFELVADFTISTNTSISEIGIFKMHNIYPYRTYLLVRDVLPTPINVPAGATLRVKYTFVFPV